MSQGRRIGSLTLFAAMAAVASLLLSPATVKAEAPAAEEAAGSAMSVSLDFTIPTDYYFRGIPQENESLIFQPGATVSVAAGEFEAGDGMTFSINPYLGIWASMHETNRPNVYEVDYIIGVEVGMPYDLTLDVNYVWYTAPSAAAEFAQEVGVGLTYDATKVLQDQGMPEGLTLEAWIFAAFETANGADGLTGAGGGDEGIYLELGLESTYPILQGDYEVIAKGGVLVGLSLDDYYEYVDPATGTVEDETFGYVDLYLGADMPLNKFIPNKYGNWTLSASVHFLFKDDSSLVGAGAIAPTDEDFKALGMVSLGIEF